MTPEELVRYQSALAEVDALRQENLALRDNLERKERLLAMPTRLAAWSLGRWLGADVRKSAEDLDGAIRHWQAGRVPPPLSEATGLLTALAVRYTRLGLFRVVVAVVITVSALWFSFAQVQLLRNQNELLSAQKQMQAAEYYFRFTREYDQLQHASNAASRTTSQLTQAISLPRTSAAHQERDAVIAAAKVPTDQLLLVSTTCAVLPGVDPNELIQRALQLRAEAKDEDSFSTLLRARDWWQSASDGCQRRLQELNEQSLRFGAEMTTDQPRPMVPK